MRFVICFAALAAIGLVGCDPNNVPSVRSSNTTSNPASVKSTSPARDNSAVNQRDADKTTKTPIDQNENEADVKRTADIRKRLLDESGLSVNARNAKVITADGKVTLRGPVASDAEKETLERIALEVAGAGNVDNQLEVVK